MELGWLHGWESWVAHFLGRTLSLSLKKISSAVLLIRVRTVESYFFFSFFVLCRLFFTRDLWRWIVTNIFRNENYIVNELEMKCFYPKENVFIRTLNFFYIFFLLDVSFKNLIIELYIFIIFSILAKFHKNQISIANYQLNV